MRRRPDPPPVYDLRDRIIGLGDSSLRKSYYPELQARLDEVAASRDRLDEKSRALEALVEELERASDSARRSEERFRRVFEQTQDGVLLVSRPDGRVALANPVAARLLGREAEGLQGHAAMGLGLGDAFGSLLALAWSGVSGSLLYEEDLRIPLPDGGELRADLTVSPLELDGVPHLLATLRDMGGQRRTEEQVRQLSQAMGQSPAAVAILDARGELEFYNPSFSQLPECLREDVVRRMGACLGAAGTERAPAWRGELQARDATGRTHWAELSVGPVQDELGDARHAHAVVVDITQRKELETQLRQSQKMEAIGQLAGGVAHDFNNLLTVINGYSEILLLDMKPGEPRHDELREIRQAGRRAQALTRQLLAFSRKQVLQPVVLDLGQLLRDMERMLSRLIGEDIELFVSTPPGLRRIKADPGQLEQVLLNLAVNARDAMPEGGRLLLETSNCELDQVYADQHVDVRPGSYVMLSVADSGTGMPPEVLARIFEPFFTTKTAGNGTGLGLSTVYGIVRQSGGHIFVYSEPGQGSVFKVYLPVSPDAPAGAESAGDSPLVHADGLVWVVEDNESVRQLTQRVLEQRGFRVRCAASAEEALGFWDEGSEQPVLVLTDVVMSGWNGRQLAAELRARRPELPIVFMSGYTDHAILRQGHLEADEIFLQKPFTVNQLLEKLHTALERAAHPDPSQTLTGTDCGQPKKLP